MIVESTFTIGPAQADSRRYVAEMHIADDARRFPYEWLWDGGLDPQLVMEERAAVINAALAARAAALQAVVGTEVPYTKHEFLSRFTQAERIAIRARAKTDGTLEDFMEMLNASGGVYMTLARPGLAYLSHSAIGILTEERAAIIGAD